MSASNSAASTDARFAHIATDPRFKPLKSKHNKNKQQQHNNKDDADSAPKAIVDDRFSALHSDPAFQSGFENKKIDAYGRRNPNVVNSNANKKHNKSKQQSSSSAASTSTSAAAQSVDDSAASSDDATIGQSYRSKRGVAPPSSDEDESSAPEQDDDDSQQASSDAELSQAGSSDSDSQQLQQSELEVESEDDDSDSTDLDELEEEEAARETALHAETAQSDEQQVTMTEHSTCRLAMVNAPFDRLKSEDILKLAQSFIPDRLVAQCTEYAENKGIRKVSVYLSEFGKQRMEEEKKIGPVGLYNSRLIQQLEQKQVAIQQATANVADAADADSDDAKEDAQSDAESDSNAQDEDANDSDASSNASATQQQQQQQQQSRTSAAAATASSSSYQSIANAADPSSRLTALQQQEREQEQLRAYELSRLKYYYALIECESVDVASALYAECDGLEFESSAAVLDLRFVPDEMTFDDATLRDECSRCSMSYTAPAVFTTKALQNTRVALSWDDEDVNRKVLTKSSKWSKDAEMEDDLRAYLASDDDDSEAAGSDFAQEVSGSESDPDDKQVLKKKARAKYADLLGELATADPDDAADKSNKPVEPQMMQNAEGGFEITFDPQMKHKGQQLLSAIEARQTQAGETSWEKHLRQRKEKALAKKVARKAKLKSSDKSSTADGSDEDNVLAGGGDSDVGLDADDPMMREAFGDGSEYASLNTARDIFGDDHDDKQKKSKQQKKQNVVAEEETDEQRRDRENLELLLLNEAGDETATHGKGYNLAELIKQNKQSGNKKKSKKQKAAAAAAAALGGSDATQQQQQDTFEVDTRDSRFVDLFANPEFNIDPTNPQFKPTKGTHDIIEERQRQRDKLAKQQEKQVKLAKQQLKLQNSNKATAKDVAQSSHTVAVSAHDVDMAPPTQDVQSLVQSIKSKTQSQSTLLPGSNAMKRKQPLSEVAAHSKKAKKGKHS